MLLFDWDPVKAAENLRKHRIGFEAASVALEDSFAIEEQDSVIDGEERLRVVGMADGQVVVLVIYTIEPINSGLNELARIISARKASPQERELYELERTASSRKSVD